MVQRPGFNYAVNGFRGLCIFLVFLYHIENSGIIPVVETFQSFYDHLRHFINSFKYGVEMFFMISGYVIIGSLKRHSTAGSFLLDRALRIYPTWVPLHLLSFIAGPLLARGIFETYDPALWTITFFADLFFLPTILPFHLVHPAAWSLSYEWCFYLVSALAVFALPKATRRSVNFAIIFLISAALINFYPRGLFFVPGVILALYEEKIRQYVSYLKFPLPALVLFLLAWLGTGVGPAELDTFISEWIFDHRIFYAIIAFVTGTYMFACVVLNQGMMSRWLHVGFMQFYGKISYAFYLWSPVAMMVSKIAAVKLTPYLGGWGAVMFFTVVSFILSTIISWMNWVVIETYLTKRLKQRLSLQKSHDN